MENLALVLEKVERLLVGFVMKEFEEIICNMKLVFVLLLVLIPIRLYTQNSTNRIIISKGTVINCLKLNGYVVVDTDEKVVFDKCDIYATSGIERDYQIYINNKCANVEIKNSRIHCDNHSVRYGIYAPHQIKSLVIKNCEFDGFSEIAINCPNRIETAKIESNEIHDIGTLELRNGKYRKNSIGIRINKNLDDINPDFSQYDGQSIVIKDNVIRNLISFYTESNDAIECHGILVYGNNVMIDGNTVENMMAGTTKENISVFCGSEHEGIYVKGDNCTISNNILRNACGNTGSEGAIAVKWFGKGGRIVNNKIYQCFGNAIWTQCRDVDICNNQIYYTKFPEGVKGKIDRFYGVYNYVRTSWLIPIHKNKKYETNINNNSFNFEDVDDINGFVMSFDNNIDDINIIGNTISISGYIQLFRIFEKGKGNGIKRTVKIQGNEIEKAYPVRNAEYVQQDILIGCGNDSTSTLSLVISNNDIKYRKTTGTYSHMGNVLRNYKSEEKIQVYFSNNTFSLPQYISSDFLLLEKGMRHIEFAQNTINTHLDRLINVGSNNGICDVILKSNNIGANMGVIQLHKDSRIGDFTFDKNIGNSSVTIICADKECTIDNLPCNVTIKGNRIKILEIVNNIMELKVRGKLKVEKHGDSVPSLR